MELMRLTDILARLNEISCELRNHPFEEEEIKLLEEEVYLGDLIEKKDFEF